MALIPPFFLDCVVALGTNGQDGKRQWIASGFLFGDFVEQVDENKARYVVYLVTNRHVFEGEKTLYVRFNPKEDAPAREYTLDVSKTGDAGGPIFHSSPDIDLGAIRINPVVLREHEIQFAYFRSNFDVAGKERLSELGVSEGDFGYALGFPMGLIGGERNFVIARSGSIARVRDYLAGTSNEILMDCLTFPGNSGGPVVTRPEAMAIQGTRSQGAAYLIGVVAQSIQYSDVAVSMQTRRARVVFEDNSGLTAVVPIEYLIELIDSFRPNEVPEARSTVVEESKP